jgi:hypothetical protein
MKRCPQCNSTYSDETLKFCLSDGAPLVEPEVEGQKTEAFSSVERREMRIDIGKDEKETVAIETPAMVTRNEQKKKGFGGFFLGFLASILVVVLIGSGAAAIYFLVFPDKTNDVVTNTATPTPDPDVEALKKRVEELQGKVDEKDKKKETRKDTPTSTPTLPAGTVTVNSPSDGFLALRTVPNHKTGQRIAKIPHGSKISIAGCQKRIKIGKRTGRWCRTSYGGKSGWIFDAWVRR